MAPEFIKYVDYLAKKYKSNYKLGKHQTDIYLTNYKNKNTLSKDDVEFIDRIIGLKHYEFAQIQSFEQMYEINKTLKNNTKSM